MTESKAFQSVVIQVAIQAAMAVVMAIGEADEGPILGISAPGMVEADKDTVSQQ